MKLQRAVLILATVAGCDDTYLTRAVIVCENGTTVSQKTDCPLHTQTISRECPDGSQIPMEEPCPPTVPPEGAVVTVYACGDGTQVDEPGKCKAAPIECAPGSAREGLACTCPADTTLEFSNGLVVVCPASVVITQTFFVCDGAAHEIVADSQLCAVQAAGCPANSQNIGGACTCPTGELLIFADGAIVRCPEQEVDIRFYYVCADGQVVDTAGTCPTRPVECPIGSVLYDGGCTCPSGVTLYDRVTQLPIRCPMPGTDVRIQWVCPDLSVAATRSECPGPPIPTACPPGSTLLGGQCTCSPGMTVVLEDGRTIACATPPVPPVPCNGLLVTGLPVEELVAGEKMILPSGQNPLALESFGPYLKFKVSACNGDELVLGSHVLTATMSAGTPRSTQIKVQTVDWSWSVYLPNGQVPVSRVLDPDFLENHGTQAGTGVQQINQPIRGREIVISVHWQAILPPGVHTVMLQEIEASSAADGRVWRWTPPTRRARHVTQNNNPCQWTYPLGYYVGDPAYDWVPPVTQGHGAGSTVETVSVLLHACQENALESMSFRLRDIDDRTRPPLQSDTTGIYFGSGVDRVYDQSTFTFENVTSVAANGNWIDDPTGIDYQGFMRSSGGSTPLPERSNTWVTLSLHVNNLLPDEPWEMTRYEIVPTVATMSSADGNRGVRTWMFPTLQTVELHHDAPP
ncbi:hypothetical protein HYV73_04840 [Candidatus Uhrbacteria bacterium]|nr:hypothetical protein [Candidatus Uhrbacteria bacterium]